MADQTSDSKCFAGKLLANVHIRRASGCIHMLVTFQSFSIGFAGFSSLSMKYCSAGSSRVVGCRGYISSNLFLFFVMSSLLRPSQSSLRRISCLQLFRRTLGSPYILLDLSSFVETPAEVCHLLFVVRLWIKIFSTANFTTRSATALLNN